MLQGHQEIQELSDLKSLVKSYKTPTLCGSEIQQPRAAIKPSGSQWTYLSHLFLEPLSF